MSFSNLRINFQINIISLSALLGFLICGVSYYIGNGQIAVMEQQRNLTARAQQINDAIRYDFVNARRKEKDFLLRLDEASIQGHDAARKSVQNSMMELRDVLAKNGNSPDKIDTIEKGFADYSAQFEKRRERMAQHRTHPR